MHLSPSFGAKFFVHAQLDFSIQSSILGYPFQLIFVCTKIQTFLITTSIRVFKFKLKFILGFYGKRYTFHQYTGVFFCVGDQAEYTLFL